MESIKNTIEELTALFNTKMAEFQKELKTSIPATSPTSNINSQFNLFRSFVLTALENLQLQVEFLSRQYDQLEMHSRKKIILLHGIAEDSKENVAVRASKTLAEHLNIPNISSDSFRHCHRLGHMITKKPRPVLIKFKDQSVKDKVWSTKSSLKGSGITMSEFLTKGRHKTFLAARQRFGVAKCWTRDGFIIVLSPDGSRHRITTMAELQAIQSAESDSSVPQMSPDVEEAPKPSKGINPRFKRTVKKQT
ncbi:uncharacterized protein LOC124543823 [Vanessa cardui]|uniref:uncharacterized protein LOC124543823 n=1 Tax=Vanessa cardui TaxID=171605 RepID=UPI001F140318|nr:uncharacterized protein LOC124543823 [Vanessa cardui]